MRALGPNKKVGILKKIKVAVEMLEGHHSWATRRSFWLFWDGCRSSLAEISSIKAFWRTISGHNQISYEYRHVWSGNFRIVEFL